MEQISATCPQCKHTTTHKVKMRLKTEKVLEMNFDCELCGCEWLELFKIEKRNENNVIIL